MFQEIQKKIKLVKIDIDKNPNIAGQLRVQSIPAVFAFSNGQPVDGFMGAQTPTQIQDFIKKIIDGFGPQDSDLTAALSSGIEMLEGKNYDKAGAMAKVFASEVAMKTTVEAVQVHGGYGFVKEYHVERLMRDAKITQIYEGTSEIQRIIISRSILK